MAKPTDGEWKARTMYGGLDIIVATAEKLLADLCYGKDIANKVSKAETLANAHVMAASKELLAACEALPLDINFEDAADFKDHVKEFMEAMRLARSAIAKARGRLPR